VRIDKGVPQGSTLSPSMFNVYLEDAIMSSQILANGVEQNKIKAFADDLLLIADSIEEVEIFLKEIMNWKSTHGLEINVGKTVWLSN
jgi:hypothetical protein